MNLSKVYSTQDTFQPEDIIRVKLAEPAFFNQSVISSGQTGRGFERQELTAEPPRQKTVPENSTEPKSTKEPERPTGETHAKLPEQEQQKTAAPPPPKEKKITPPAPPPGIPQHEVDRLVAKAYEKGVAEGLQQAEHDFGSATASLTLICQQLDTLRETVIHNSVGEIQNLVIAIAEKVIRHSVREQSQTIVETVEEAIQKAVKSGEFYIYVNPDDHAVIAAKADELIAGMNGLNNIVVKKDASVGRGGCRVESDNCTVDGTITSQLEIIRDHMHDH
jgi:flagellar assembly protein FliH